MKRYNIIFLLAALPFYLFSMEKKLTKKQEKQENLVQFLNNIQDTLGNSSLSTSARKQIDQLLNPSQEALNQKKINKKTLSTVEKNLNQAQNLLASILDSNNKLSEALKAAKLHQQPRITIPIQQQSLTPTSPSLPRRPQIQRLPSTHFVNLETAEEFDVQDSAPNNNLNRPIIVEQPSELNNPSALLQSLIPQTPAPSLDQLGSPQLVSEVTDSSSSQLLRPPVITPDVSSIAQQFSNNLEVLKIDSQPSWKKIIGYFSAAGLFTGIGFYSYYKLQPEQWYRPALIGLSCLGSMSFGYLGYRDWKLRKN